MPLVISGGIFLFLIKEQIFDFLLTIEQTCAKIALTKQERSFYTYVVSLPPERKTHEESEWTA
jgi:hypothetical protein